MIQIKKEILQQFVEHCEATPSVEVCALMTGNLKNMVADEIHLIENVSKSFKEVDYVMNPSQAFRVYNNTTILNKKADKDLVVICHDHPTGQPIPSSIDLHRAEWEVVYLIYSPLYRKSRAWLYKDGAFSELKIELI